MKYCDLKCEYARWPDKLADGSKTCRTFIALFCTKLNQLVDKNGVCRVDFTEEDEGMEKDAKYCLTGNPTSHKMKPGQRADRANR